MLISLSLCVFPVHRLTRHWQIKLEEQVCFPETRAGLDLASRTLVIDIKCHYRRTELVGTNQWCWREARVTVGRVCFISSCFNCFACHFCPAHAKWKQCHEYFTDNMKRFKSCVLWLRKLLLSISQHYVWRFITESNGWRPQLGFCMFYERTQKYFTLK